MALPAWKTDEMSHETTPDSEAQQVLRRLEPLLTRIMEDQAAIREEQAAMRADIKEIRSDLTKTMLEVAEIKGQLKYMPTMWTLAGLVFAIFAASFVLIRFAAPHL